MRTPIIVATLAAAAATLTMPKHAIGDDIYAVIYRSNSNTLPTTPSGLNWSIKQSGGVNTNAAILAYKQATSESETFGTWTGATQVAVFIVRGGAPGVTTTASGSSTTGTYGALSNMNKSNQSIVIAAGMNRSASDVINSPPAGMTSLVTPGGAMALYYLGSQGTSFAAKNVTLATNTGWRTFTIEIAPGNWRPYDIMFDAPAPAIALRGRAAVFDGSNHMTSIPDLGTVSGAITVDGTISKATAINGYNGFNTGAAGASLEKTFGWASGEIFMMAIIRANAVADGQGAVFRTDDFGPNTATAAAYLLDDGSSAYSTMNGYTSNTPGFQASANGIVAESGTLLEARWSASANELTINGVTKSLNNFNNTGAVPTIPSKLWHFLEQTDNYDAFDFFAYTAKAATSVHEKMAAALLWDYALDARLDVTDRYKLCPPLVPVYPRGNAFIVD